MARFLVVLDVDSTLIENEVIELLAAQAGSLAEVAESRRGHERRAGLRSESPIACRHLKGLSEAVFDTVERSCGHGWRARAGSGGARGR